MSKETYELYKKQKLSDLKALTFQPEDFGGFIIFSLLGGIGIGFITYTITPPPFPIFMGIIFITIGMYGMARKIAIAKEDN